MVKMLVPFLLLSTAALAATPDITIEQGWIRALPGTVPSGGYFVLHNAGKKPATLIGAQSPACGMLMLHMSENKGGMSAMRHVESVNVAPGGTLEFKQGGYHLMCMQATAQIKPGATVPVTLIFQDGMKATANFAVRDAMGK
jgi:periplasmic copper chaperone A